MARRGPYFPMSRLSNCVLDLVFDRLNLQESLRTLQVNRSLRLHLLHRGPALMKSTTITLEFPAIASGEVMVVEEMKVSISSPVGTHTSCTLALPRDKSILRNLRHCRRFFFGSDSADASSNQEGTPIISEEFAKTIANCFPKLQSVSIMFGINNETFRRIFNQFRFQILRHVSAYVDLNKIDRQEHRELLGHRLEYCKGVNIWSRAPLTVSSFGAPRRTRVVRLHVWDWVCLGEMIEEILENGHLNPKITWNIRTFDRPNTGQADIKILFGIFNQMTDCVEDPTIIEKSNYVKLPRPSQGVEVIVDAKGFRLIRKNRMDLEIILYYAYISSSLRWIQAVLEEVAV